MVSVGTLSRSEWCAKVPRSPRRSARRGCRGRGPPAASASSPGGNSWLGSARTTMPAARAERMPLWESSIAAVAAGRRRRRRAASRKTSGAGLPRATSSEDDPGLEVRREAAALHHHLDHLEVGGAREPERPARREPLDRLARAVEQRQPLAVPGEQAPHDLGVDLARVTVDLQVVAHVDRPLRRAHAEHRPVGLVLPRAAPLFVSVALGVPPRRLGVEQDAVEVEDDGVDQAGDQGIEPRPAVLETAILAVGPVPPRGPILAR